MIIKYLSINFPSPETQRFAFFQKARSTDVESHNSGFKVRYGSPKFLLELLKAAYVVRNFRAYYMGDRRN